MAGILALCLLTAAAAEPQGSARVDGAAVLALATKLASPAFTGRQAGSEGGFQAGDFLAATLRDAGYRVDFLEFAERAPFTEGPALLEIAYPDGSRSSLRYREDFREVVTGGWNGGRAEGPLVDYAALVSTAILSDSREEEHRLLPREEPRLLSGSLPKGAIVLMAARYYEPSLESRLLREGASGLIVELREASTEIKPIYAGQDEDALVEVKTGLIRLGVSRTMYARLVKAAAAGARVAMANPAFFRDLRGRTIIGTLDGPAPGFAPRTILTAHYDHIGKDADGSYFPGALDNASGTALVVAIASAVARMQPEGDFAVILTDAEEVNLSGAAAFARNPPFPIRGIDIVNLDMVGSDADLALSVYSTGGSASLALADEVVDLLQGAGFGALSLFPNDYADHAAFARAGAAAVSVVEFDERAYHTKSDIPEWLSAVEFGMLGDALALWILERLDARH